MGLEDTTSEGRLLAALGYVVFPLAVVPLALRKDRFSYHHAQIALGVQGAFLAVYMVLFALAMVLFFVTCGMSNLLFVPLMMVFSFWPMATGIHGLVLAIQGDWSEPLGAFGLGDRVATLLKLEPLEIEDESA